MLQLQCIKDQGHREKQLALNEAQHLRALHTQDGNVLLFTVHIPDRGGQQVLFPVSESDLPKGEDSSLLFELSSVLPSEMLSSALEAGLQVRDSCRLMVLNADAMAASKLIVWGSSSGGANKINAFINQVKGV